MSRPIADNWKGIPHCRIRADLTSSNAYRVLGPYSVKLYLDLRSKLRNGSNGNVSATLKDMRHYGWKSSATLASALYELLAMGILIKTRSGGVERGSKVCSLYAFTDLDVNPNPKIGIEKARPSFAYREFKTIAEAIEARDAGVKKLREEALERKGRTKAKKKFNASISEAVKAVIASDFEQERNSAASNSEQVKRGINAT